ncbi:hypothetical protein E4U15_004465, partial [Claviceps sp. LM218 group G6]
GMNPKPAPAQYHDRQPVFSLSTKTTLTKLAIETLLKDLTPSPSSPSPWQTEVITIEDNAAPADRGPHHH